MGFEFRNREDMTLASYTPRAFFIRMHIDTLGDAPDELSWTQPSLQVLMHEFGHLLQDRATIFGVLDFVHFYDSFWSVRDCVDHWPPGQAIPIQLRNQLVADALPGTTTPLALAQIEAIRRVTYLSSIWRPGDANWAYESHEVVIHRLPFAGHQFDIPEVRLRLVDNVENEEYTRSFGAWEVKEAYSVAIETIHGGDLRTPQHGFEYVIVERILQREFGELDPRQVVALCHWALQWDAPAERLMTLIDQLKAEDIHPLPPAEDLYDYCRDRARRDGYEVRAETLIEQLWLTVRQHERANPGSTLIGLLRWYAESAQTHLRRNLDSSRRFPLDTFACASSQTMSPEELNQQLRALFTETPVPMLQAIDGQTWSFGGAPIDDVHVFFIRALVELVDDLWHGTAVNWQCPFYDPCPLPIRDIECTSSPWRKGRLQQTCAYGMAAQLLHIVDRSFIDPSVR
jgi:hypothetical protein